MFAKTLSHQALQAIAVNRSTGAFLRNGKPQTCLAVGIEPDQDGEVGIDGFTGALKDPLELCLVEQPRGAGKALAAWDLFRFLA